MKLTWTAGGWADYLHWQEADRAVVSRVNVLLRDVLRSPYQGIGHPEPLKGKVAGWWSRRITLEHRLVYRVAGSGDNQAVEVASCRYHY